MEDRKMKTRNFTLKTLGISSILALSVSAPLVLADPPNRSQVIQVSASVAHSCKVTGHTDISFEEYDPLVAADVETTGSIKIKCAPGSAYKIKLGEGAHTQTLVNGDSELSYELYQDSNYATAWGGTTDGETPNVLTSTATSSAEVTHTIHAKIPQGQDEAVAGAYTGQITAAIVY